MRSEEGSHFEEVFSTGEILMQPIKTEPGQMAQK